MFNRDTYITRRQKLTQKIQDGIILLLGNVDSPMNYADNSFHFRQDSSFLYFFGLDFQKLAGVIDVDAGEEYLFGDEVDIEDIIWMGPQVALREKAEIVGITKVEPYKNLHTVVEKAIAAGRKVHFLPPYRAENKLLLNELTGIAVSKLKAYSSLALIKAIVDLRSVKEEQEIAEIRKACAVGYQMHVTAMKMARAGVWEQTIAGTIEGIANAGGGMVSFPVILSQNGETLHNHDHSKILTDGRLLLVDAGAEISSHYASDFTRTIPVSGKFTQKQREIYDIVLAANNRARELTRPGSTYLSVHLAMAEVIASGLNALGLMKGNMTEAVRNGAHALFMPHGLGHMLGLDVHDMEDLGQIYVGYDDETRPVDQFGTAYLRMGRKLQPGFVITNEPGIYFIPALIEKWKSEKINNDFINFDRLNEYLDFGGIRLEDDILVTDNGCQIIGERIPITAQEVENTMKE
ncbi:MAG TPA: aminopeptidase P family protein [Prolixibacteraceae bacterium]|nr:aminopeptidase P family protein [Prolixibacteraceae bacterium]